MQRRSTPGDLYNFLEFPGGKIEEEETPEQAIVREIGEEVNITVENPLFFKLSRYKKNQKTFLFYTYLFKNKDDHNLKDWFSIEDKSYLDEIPPANLELFTDLKSFFGNDMKEFLEFEEFLWK